MLCYIAYTHASGLKSHFGYVIFMAHQERLANIGHYALSRRQRLSRFSTSFESHAPVHAFEKQMVIMKILIDQLNLKV